MEFTNLIEVTEYFSDKQKCIEYLTHMRWANSVQCVFCVNDKVYELKGENKRYKCAKCRKQFSAIKGTIFENSPIPLQKWFLAVYILTSYKKGVSSVQLASDLGVTQKTAWFMAQRIRYALKVKSFDAQLEGPIQCDETFIGGKNKNRHADKKVLESQGRSLKDKTPVFGVLQTGGQLHTSVVPDTKASTLKPIIKELVKNGSIIVTDEWTAYQNLSKDYDHIVINHKKREYVKGIHHINGIEGFWSVFKRGIYGIYHQVSPKHLHRYCDEFAFRYNTKNLNNTCKFDLSLKRTDCRLTYKNLISK